MLPTHVSTSVFTYVSWTMLNLKYNFKTLIEMGYFIEDTGNESYMETIIE